VPPAPSRAPEQALQKLAAELDTLREENQALRDLLEQARAGSTAEQTAVADRVTALQAELARRVQEMEALEQRYESARRTVSGGAG
jgi:predicted  nucleic acid-binding Zn-ribbon protein